MKLAHWASQKTPVHTTLLNRRGGPSPPYHDWENDGGHSGLEDPEDSQAEDLHEGEEVDAAQGHMAQEGMVWLVLGGHQEELAALPELARRVWVSARQPGPGGGRPAGAWD